jgi:hypothetical protein
MRDIDGRWCRPRARLAPVRVLSALVMLVTVAGGVARASDEWKRVDEKDGVVYEKRPVPGSSSSSTARAS